MVTTKMPNIYELTANAAYLQQLLESGEIDEQTYADSLEAMMVDEKVENICKVIRNLEGLATSCKAEEDRIAQKRRAAENGVKRLKDSLVDFLTQTKSKKMTAGLFTVSLGSSVACEITNEEELPAEYLVPQPPKIDKTAITKTIKAGELVPGAKLVQNTYARIK